MDKKEMLLLDHYKKRIENNLFDEYDVLGLLIMIRPYIDNYKNLLEFANIIAHRKRDRGMGMSCISVIQNNGFKLIEGTKKVIGFEGISYEILESELFCFLCEYGIDASKKTLRELIFCIFSLSQFVEYKRGDVSGVMYLIQGNNDTIGLGATEGNRDSCFVCFSYMTGVKHIRLFEGGLIKKTVVVKRVGNQLGMFDGDTVVDILE